MIKLNNVFHNVKNQNNITVIMNVLKNVNKIMQ